MSDGLLDTNVVAHARTTDEHSVECRTFLRMRQISNRRKLPRPRRYHYHLIGAEVALGSGLDLGEG